MRQTLQNRARSVKRFWPCRGKTFMARRGRRQVSDEKALKRWGASNDLAGRGSFATRVLLKQKILEINSLYCIAGVRLKNLDEVSFPDRFRDACARATPHARRRKRKAIAWYRKKRGARQFWRTQSTKKRTPPSPGSSTRPWMSVSNPGNLRLKSRANWR